MSLHDIIRAWKDEEYRLGLSDEQRALLPAHPAGLIALDDAELDQAAGASHCSDSNCCTYNKWCRSK